jgi:hypothetical protein
MVVSVGAGEQNLGQLGLHLSKSQISGPFLGHNNYVPPRQPLFVVSEKLPQEPLNPVAPEGLAHLAPHHQTQPGAWTLSWGQADTEVRCVQFFSPCLGPEILSAPTKPLLSGKAGHPLGVGGGAGCVSRAGGLGGVLQRGSLYLTPRGACDPWPGGAAKSGVHLWSAYASKSRGCGSGAVYSAEKFVS